MKQFACKPTIHAFDNCKAFVDEFKVDANDVVLTNAVIYDPFFGPLDCKAQVVLLEKFGTTEPTDIMVDAVIKEIQAKKPRRLIAIGGGSVIDVAKCVAVAQPGEGLDSIFDRKDTLKQEIELIILPTTCGTGSEVTAVSVINRTKLKTKQGLLHEALFARHSVLVSDLISKLPYGVFATSSLDALVHAVEAYLSPKATPFTYIFAKESARLIMKGYVDMAKNGKDARQKHLKEFLLGSLYGGLAFSSTDACAAVHALSYPMGAAFHIPHGEANYVLFLGVLRKYASIRSDGAFSELMCLLAEEMGCTEKQALDELAKLLETIYPLKPLHEYGMTEQHAKDFAANVLKTQTRLLANNFVPLDEKALCDVYLGLL